MGDADSCGAGYSFGMDRRELTEREQDVVKLAAKGQTNPEIADELGVSIATVKRHLANVMIKWNVRNRTNVALEARDRGLIQQAAEEQAPYTPAKASKKERAPRATARPQSKAAPRRAQKSKRRKG